MSLHHLGIAHFPVLHRQFSSPQSKGSLDSSPSQDLTEDNKDVLVERLNDLVHRLSDDDSMDNGIVTALHSEVDKIELILRGGRQRRRSKLGLDLSNPPRPSKDEDVFWSPSSPSQSIRFSMPRSFSNATQPRQSEPQITPERAVEIAMATQELAARLAATAIELQTRKEESDHIHDLLITRAEKAAERILVLEYRIKEMEEDFEANQSELKFLRIKLQAIEVQASQYAPHEEDLELTRSIMNWKIDWEDIDRRSRERRKRHHHASISHLSDSQTFVEESR